MDKKQIHTLAQSFLTEMSVNNRSINHLIDDSWIVHDEFASPGKEVKQFELSSYFFDLDIKCKIALKMALLREPSVRINGDVINCKHATFDGILVYIRRIGDALRALNLRCLMDIETSTIEEFYVNLMRLKGGGVIAKSSIHKTILFLRKLWMAGCSCALPDAPRCEVTIDDCDRVVKERLSKEVDYVEWLNGGSLDGLPVELGLILLDEALKLIRDVNTNAIIHGVYRACHGFLSRFDGSSSTRDSHDCLCDRLLYFFRYDWRSDESGPYLLKSFKRDGTLRNHKVRNKESDTYKLANDFFVGFFESGGDSRTLILPARIEELNHLVRSKLVACAVAIYALSGARKSEVISLSRNSFHKDDIGSVTFLSKIVKTNHGVETERVISEAAYDAYRLAIELHSPSVHSCDISEELLKVNTPWKKVRPITAIESSGEESMRDWCIRVLQSRVSDFNPEDFKFNPHAFRHLFAEFALRRFDGNVPEALRQHFRHAFKSYMTNHYTKDKIKINAPELGKKYMRDLLGRAASGREELFGPVGRYILKIFSSMKVVTQESIEEMLDEFDIVEPHEYGYCMIRKDHKTQARCYDKSTQTPVYANAKFEHCGGCVGSLRLANHRDAIMRIGMREQEVLHSREEQGLTILADVSRKILRMCEHAIKDLDNSIPLTDVTFEAESCLGYV